MNLNIYAENLGKMDLIIYVLIDLEREVKEDIELVMKEKTHRFKLLQRRIHFGFCNLKSVKKFSVSISEFIKRKICPLKNGRPTIKNKTS